MRTVKAGILYFAVVFAAGFALGPARLFWLVPRLGPRYAELLEMPVMLAVTVVVARWVVRRLAVPPSAAARLGMGVIAFALMITAEFSLVLWLRGLALRDYFATRDPVSGTAYYLLLLIFALMPLLLRR